MDVDMIKLNAIYTVSYMLTQKQFWWEKTFCIDVFLTLYAKLCRKNIFTLNTGLACCEIFHLYGINAFFAVKFNHVSSVI